METKQLLTTTTEQEKELIREVMARARQKQKQKQKESGGDSIQPASCSHDGGAI